MVCKYQSKNGATLTQLQEELLEKIEKLPFPFEGISIFSDLRQRSGLTVVISNRKSLIRILMDSISAIESKIGEFKKSGLINNSNVEDEIYDRKRWAEKQLGIAENPQSKEIPLLGLYTRKLLWFDNSAPVVYLFADNIRDYAKRKGVNEDNVFAFVFVHEMMHAYYDAFKSVGFPCKERIEEAFAEFGMLLFLESFAERSLFADARDNVISKIQDGPREYGFGFELYNMSGVNGIKMINRYKEISNWIDSSVVWTFPAQGLGNYFSDFSDYDNNSDATHADYCFKDIQIILNYPWQQPSITVQPRVNTYRASSISFPSNQFKRESMIYSSHTQTEELVCLIRDKEIETILAAVIRLLKHEGFESGLTFYGRHIHYLGKDLFCYTTPAHKKLIHSIVISESISVSGTTVLPMFIGMRLKKSFGGIVRLLSEFFGDSFALVRETDGFGLYGPPLIDDYNSILASEPKQFGKRRFDVIVRETSEVLGQNVGRHIVPLLVVKHFCESNGNITWKELQVAFDRVECNMPKYLDWITPKPIVEAFYLSFTHPCGKSMPLFHDDPIKLSSGETVLVTSRVMSDYQFDFRAFLKVADKLGYEINGH